MVVTGDLKDTLVLLTPVAFIFLLTDSSILSTVQPWRFPLVTCKFEKLIQFLKYPHSI